MFLPRKFAETDPAALDWLVNHDAFATLVTMAADGAPFATHLPVLMQRNGDTLVFEAHMARANPQWQQIGQQSVLLVLHGPHAYVSPSWYPDPDVSVPTWNYAAAHVYGRCALVHDEAALEGMVARLAAKYEQGVGSSWRFPESAPGTRAELRGIVGMVLTVERVEVKYKLNQHHPADKVRAAAQALQALPQDDARAVAALMLERLARREDTHA